MQQKTYHISNYSEQKLISILQEVADSECCKTAAQVLLIMMEQNWNKDIIREKTALAKALVPKAEIVGITHFDNLLQSNPPDNTVLTFLFFENPSFMLNRISLKDFDDNTAGSFLNNLIRNCPSPKCIMLFPAGSPRDIGAIMNMAGDGNPDIPIFGGMAAVSSFLTKGPDLSYVFDSSNVYEDTLLSVLFFGERLHVKASYNMGWTPVGKTMTITKLKNPYTVSEIDGHTAADIYEKYLGVSWKTNSLSIINTCEFPLIVSDSSEVSVTKAYGASTHTLRMARIPFSWSKDGDLNFAITMHKGEKIRLSYGFPKQIFSQINDSAEEFRLFAPEAMLMVICLTRMIFLRNQEHRETDAFRNVVPDAAFLHGNSEFYRYHGVGGEMHSALIAIGFKEGEHDIVPELSDLKQEYTGDAAIPLELRLMSFMRAVTKDLEQTTDELLHLKGNLEEEVEKKTRENEALSLHVVQTLAEAIDAKDTYTNGHSSRVAAYSQEIAKRFGYSEREQKEIYMIGLLHDVGKIGVPDAVINKPGKLSDDEFEMIKNHPVMGARILKAIKEMPKLVTGARWHHERYDGKGYPDGLSGTVIPEEARIIAVADAYDAMSSNRSYRNSMSQEKVREQIENGKGTQFDPVFAEIMLNMIDEDTEYLMRERDTETMSYPWKQ